MSENSSFSENMGILLDTVFEFAQEFPHDERIFWVGFLGVLISGAAVVLSCLLNRNQSKFLEQQNKIALFEKRYYYFNVLKNIFLHSPTAKTLTDDLLQTIEPKLYVSEKTTYHKLKICATILLSKDILRLDLDCPVAKDSLYTYSCEKLKELMTLIYAMRYVFDFNEKNAKELNRLIEILFDILTEPQNDKEEALRKSLAELENFFATSSLYDYLEKQVYIMNNLKYFPKSTAEATSPIPNKS